MGKGLGVLRSGSGNSSSRIVGCAVAALEEDVSEQASSDPNRGGEVLTVREGEVHVLRFGWANTDLLT